MSDVEDMLRAAGFGEIKVSVREESREFIKDWFPGSGVEEYVVSANIEAKKPKQERTLTANADVDENIKELIAIGASVSGHCQPCLSYHVNKAKELGIDEARIREAIKVGQMVEKGALSAMREFAAGVFDDAADMAGPCCADGKSQGDDCCS